MNETWNAPTLVLGLSAMALLAFAEESYSPHVDGSDTTNVYWGDTHVHTALSSDAFVFGTRLTPDDAYRFAKGETVRAASGEEVRLRRPLDFLMVSDHAENMGVIARVAAGDEALLATAAGKRTAAALNYPVSLLEALNADTEDLLNAFNAATLMAIKADQGLGKGLGHAGYGTDARFSQSVWGEVIGKAERHNDPGSFTTFSGYEWTVAAGGHRNVIFADGPELTGQVVPFSAFDSSDPEDLWAYLNDYEERSGGQVFAIPHNGNLSGNRMFALTTRQGEPLTEAYARRRSRWEPLYEVTQIKGHGETHPLISPNDEFAGDEIFRWGITKSQPDSKKQGKGPADEKEQTEGPLRPQPIPVNSYARSALMLGLMQAAELGVNPFKFGLIGSTDSHTALATADQGNFWGKMPGNEPSRNRVVTGWNYNASGYAAVWAVENTREALFAAMRRKEVYASTGPRMTVRFFGGWDYADEDVARPDLARVGYAKGVPMGGDLTQAPKGKAPSFLIRAVKDPDGANLDRVQVIKGWRDEDGELHEKIYNVALSDGRTENPKGEVPAVGSTVDVRNASYTNSIGDPELDVVWTDPDFNRAELAFYYLRVLEIPTPRWTAYDARFFGLRDLPDEIPMITQERAYTSPIWYTPNAYQW
ncbi:MAG: DUF3604 domain-containing protein [Gammaproteobacteria bacterium]|nr:DUF3604 domain-containing protein [Gammaproteobacteria bacterium]